MLCEGWYILGRGSECKLISDVNLYQNGSILEEEKKSIVKVASKVSTESEKYIKFCKTFVLKQLVKSPTRSHPTHPPLWITYWHVQITESDHQIIFCLTKIREKSRWPQTNFI